MILSDDFGRSIRLNWVGEVWAYVLNGREGEGSETEAIGGVGVLNGFWGGLALLSPSR